jgi:type I restriction-modification system DNA methylase subunit
MTGTFKPLFNSKLLAQQLSLFQPNLSDLQRLAAQEWSVTAGDPSFRSLKEKPLQGVFLSKVFDTLLGYAQVVGHADSYSMKAETASKEMKGGKTPDARLGFFSASKDITRAVVELKAPGADLDAKQTGYGGQTPVEQAFSYASKVDGCKWVIVSNFITIRLYRTTRGEGYYHQINLAELTDERRLQEFLFLFSKDHLLGDESGASVVEQLALDTHAQEEKITKEFYAFYKTVRLRLFNQLVKANPAQADWDQAEHEEKLLEKAQKILDRVLFICFCEDRRLLPYGIIRQAIEAAGTGFVQTTRWQQMAGLFDAINAGRPGLKINAYNGGLFARDTELDALVVPDEVLDDCLRLSSYDFETDLNVNILGRIFEQSISDLEALRAEIQGQSTNRKESKRKKEGVFYTPEFITRFIVENTIGKWLQERFAALQKKYDPEKIRGANKKREAEENLWEDYQEVLRDIKVLDPACGSGAFLVAAFDYLHGEYERVNSKLAEMRAGQISLFDLDRQILQQNLYGVDVNAESVEITKLSLWLKTARTDKPLNNLDDNIQCGNSIVSPPNSALQQAEATNDVALKAAFDGLPADVKGNAFDWGKGFPAVFDGGGFDCVIGNPPYVRQEVISPIKPYLEQAYECYHGSADLYTYFYERGFRLLKPGGTLSYIVSNKWLRAGYGEPLRRFFANQTVFERIIDFGHAPIFEDADTFPCIVSMRKPIAKASGESSDDGKPQPAPSVMICPVPREKLSAINLSQYAQEEGYTVPWKRFGETSWSLEPPAVDALIDKIKNAGSRLRNYTTTKLMYGIKTGLNRAFLIDELTRNTLISEDPKSNEIIKPYLRGQDIKRWHSNWENSWMILARRGIYIDDYPAVKKHLLEYRVQLEPRPIDWNAAVAWKGRKAGNYKWYEIQDTVDYWREFSKPKLLIQRIAFHSRIALSTKEEYVNDSAIILPVADLWLLACLNSPVIWYLAFRTFPHKKDEALAMDIPYVEALPIAQPTDESRAEIEPAVERLIEITKANQNSTRELLDWLRIEHSIEKPGQALEDYASLDSDSFVREVKKRKPAAQSNLTPAAIASLRRAFDDYALPAQRRRAEALPLERRISDLINQAYGLTPDEIDLMWKTAPPRMPIPPPAASTF